MKKIIIYFILLIIISLGLKYLYNLAIGIIYPLDFEEYIYESSEEFGLEPSLVMAVIKAESNYKPDAHSGVARGLMQLTDDTAQFVAEKLKIESYDVEDPKTNIRMGCYYLRYISDLYKNDIELTLAAYNAGPGNVNKWLKNPQYTDDSGKLLDIPFKETREYVKRVLKFQNIYEDLYANKIKEG